MGSGEAEEGQRVPLARARIVRTAGKWVPTSELAPLVPLVGSSSFAENSIIMIAYDVNDAPRQQLFPPEQARGGCGPRRRRPRRAGQGHGTPDEGIRWHMATTPSVTQNWMQVRQSRRRYLKAVLSQHICN